MEPKESLEEIDLQKYWFALKRRWLPALGVFSTVVAIALLGAISRKSSYEATASLLIRTDSSPALAGLNVESGNLQSLATQDSPVQTQAQIIASTPIAQQTIDALHLTASDGKPLTANAFSQSLKIKSVANTDVLEISYSSGNPEIAAAVVNKVMEVYVASNIAANRAETAAASDFITGQLPKVEVSVHQAEVALRRFKEENQVIELDNEAQAAVQLISGLDNQIAASQAQLAEATARSQTLRSQLGMNSRQAVALTSLSQAPGVQEVLTEYQQAQSDLTQAQTRYRDGHPAVATLQRKVDALGGLLQQRVGQVLGNPGVVPPGDLQFGALRQQLTANLVDAEAQRLALASQTAVLTNIQTTYRDRASTLPKLVETQADLERKLNAAQTTYQTLLTRLQEVQVAENQNVGNARIVSQAIAPEFPSGPTKKLFLAAGVVVGLLLAAVAAIAVDLMDGSVKTIKEAREIFRYTLLGIIPDFGKSGQAVYSGNSDQPIPRVLIRDNPRSPICDAYQMLQANLRFLSLDKALQAIVVTSSVSKEGKSAVTANLAASMAQVGLRVLLVDADMRHPLQHHVWGVTNLSGLSNVIVGQAEYSSTVQEVMPHLDLLTSGVIPPNPMALLDSKRMASLIETFTSTYDFVIFDTPALSGTADAAILGKMTDGVLLVVRPGVVDSASAHAAKNFLLQTGLNILGLVANGVMLKAEPDSYFYYARDNAEPEANPQPAISIPYALPDSSRNDRR